ncbi:MAG: hypothetical protein PVI88_02090 [Nitrosopumilaceae archaeon]
MNNNEVIPIVSSAGTIIIALKKSYGIIHESEAIIIIADATIKAKPKDVIKFAVSFLRRTNKEETAKGTRIIPTATVIATCDSEGSK